MCVLGAGYRSPSRARRSGPAWFIIIYIEKKRFKDNYVHDQMLDLDFYHLCFSFFV